MKKWTCSILSAVLLTVSCFCRAEPLISADGTKAFFSNIIGFFMGISGSAEASKQITIDLSENGLSEEMLIEIENINAEINAERAIATAVPETTKIEKSSILIYHTHTDEAYLKGDKDYVETSTGRTLDPDFSVVSVGKTLSDKLTEYGFNVIHDETDNVSAGFNKAYQTSLKTIEKYSNVDIYIDLHRDAYMGREPNFLSHNGTEYAHVCFVVANGENYTHKPHWQENYKKAQIMTNKLNEICPGIAKEVIFRNARYNQHLSDCCLLIEMGNEQNTLEQVKASAEIVAQAFNEIF